MTKVSFPHPFCDRYPELSHLTAALGEDSAVAVAADNAAEVHLKRIDQCPDRRRLNDDISLLNVDGACCVSLDLCTLAAV